MAQTNFQRVDQTLALVQKYWAPIVDKELRASNLFLDILTRNNQNVQTIRGGDTLKLTFINKPTSTIRSIGTNADSFESNVLTSTSVDLKVNRRGVSAFEFEDLSILMSQLDQEDSEIRAALMYDVNTQINDHIKSLISPSTSSPDNTVAGVTDFTLAQLSVVRQRAGLALWGRNEPWYLALSVQYNSDLLDEVSASDSSKTGDGVSPLVGGFWDGYTRMGFNIYEDNSLTGLTVANDGDHGIAFMPSFMKVAIGEPTFMLSSQHALKKFTYLLSVDVPIGAVQFDSKRVITIGA